MMDFEGVKEKYAEYGADVEAALKRVSNIPVSIHCWQGDDVCGFENIAGELSGGIQTTGNYPGKAVNPEQLMADFEKAASLIPGKKRINLHSSYMISDKPVDRSEILPEHFKPWVDYAKKLGIGIDFNPTLFSHPMVKDGLTLSSPDKEVRDYWVKHVKACRRVASYIASELNDNVLCNIWAPDGYKDVPADRLSPRLRLKESLDEILSEPAEGVVDSVESKVFGIGLESFTVGSNEFYTAYAASRKGVYNLLDNGHFHPTEYVSDKIPALLAFFDKVPLHVTRGVRWDSDHVVLLEDEIKEIAKEIIRNNADDKVMLGLDFFDASINRIAAWTVGTRNVQKALLYAALMPHEQLKKMQDEGNFTELMVIGEELKTLPFGDVWEEYCRREGVAAGKEWFDEVKKYEREVLSKR